MAIEKIKGTPVSISIKGEVIVQVEQFFNLGEQIINSEMAATKKTYKEESNAFHKHLE